MIETEDTQATEQGPAADTQNDPKLADTQPATEELTEEPVPAVDADRITQLIWASALQIPKEPVDDVFRMDYVTDGEKSTIEEIVCTEDVQNALVNQNLHRDKGTRWILATNGNKVVRFLGRMAKADMVASFQREDDDMPKNVDKNHMVVKIHRNRGDLRVLQIPRKLANRQADLSEIILAIYEKMRNPASLTVNDLLGSRALLHQVREGFGEFILIVSP